MPVIVLRLAGRKAHGATEASPNDQLHIQFEILYEIYRKLYGTPRLRISPPGLQNRVGGLFARIRIESIALI